MLDVRDIWLKKQVICHHSFHKFGEPRALQVAVQACSCDDLLQWNTVPSTAGAITLFFFVCPTHETIKCRCAAQLEVGC